MRAPGVPRRALLCLGLPLQVRELDAEHVRDAQHRRVGGVLLAALDAAVVGPVEPGIQGDLLLRAPQLGAPPAYRLAQGKMSRRASPHRGATLTADAGKRYGIYATCMW